MAKTRKASYLDELMAEPMRLPGCPDVIVTRGWCYQWLKKLGFETDTRKTQFGSVDYMVFGRSVSTRAREADPLTADDLTDLTQPWVVNLLAKMEADCVGA